MNTISKPPAGEPGSENEPDYTSGDVGIDDDLYPRRKAEASDPVPKRKATNTTEETERTPTSGSGSDDPDLKAAQRPKILRGRKGNLFKRFKQASPRPSLAEPKTEADTDAADAADVETGESAEGEDSEEAAAEIISRWAEAAKKEEAKAKTAIGNLKSPIEAKREATQRLAKEEVPNTEDDVAPPRVPKASSDTSKVLGKVPEKPVKGTLKEAATIPDKEDAPLMSGTSSKQILSGEELNAVASEKKSPPAAPTRETKSLLDPAIGRETKEWIQETYPAKLKEHINYLKEVLPDDIEIGAWLGDEQGSQIALPFFHTKAGKREPISDRKFIAHLAKLPRVERDEINRRYESLRDAVKAQLFGEAVPVVSRITPRRKTVSAEKVINPNSGEIQTQSASVSPAKPSAPEAAAREVTADQVQTPAPSGSEKSSDGEAPEKDSKASLVPVNAPPPAGAPPEPQSPEKATNEVAAIPLTSLTARKFITKSRELEPRIPGLTISKPVIEHGQLKIDIQVNDTSLDSLDELKQKIEALTSDEKGKKEDLKLFGEISKLIDTLIAEERAKALKAQQGKNGQPTEKKQPFWRRWFGGGKDKDKPKTT